MRLFAAVPIPDPARSQIMGLLARFRASEWPVRWVRDEGLHLTLKFFGELAPDRLEVIEEAVRIAARDTGELPLQLDELGTFPGGSRGRVLWIGFATPPALELLQDRLERGCEAIGFPPEGTPFRPHVTLGRVREGQRLPRGGLSEFSKAYQRVACLASELVLYESVLTRTGPRYETRLTLSLGA
jgi:RNA 2',3'-cyclic 3'-phosphodiesterase